MRRIIRQIYNLLRVPRMQIARSLKSKIRWTWLKVFFLRRYDSRNRSATIVGFKMKFLDYGNLSYLYNEIFLCNKYFFSADNDHPYIFDCGSNIGTSIIYFKMLYPGCRILAFEPGEESFACLQENIRNNNLLNSIQVCKAALSNREGNVEFSYDPGNPGSLNMSIKKERLSKQIRNVKATRLSKHIGEEVDLLKIDIEGAELEVIEELSNSGKLGYVKQMIIEYHHHIVKDSDDFSRMLKILEDSGFGYQIESHLERPFKHKKFQDILVYVYRKSKST
ncbi:MAG: FkbM family methyltransferase [Verrucomicrobiota bacterium]|jgi:FkbM family methyltransferase